MGRRRRFALPAVAVGALVVGVLVVAVLPRLQVAVPGDAAARPIARTSLTGPSAPDPTEQPMPTDGADVDPQPDTVSPHGGECLARMTSGSGWLDLCWAADRFGHDADPQKDYYLLRLSGSHEGLRWLVVRSQLVDPHGASFIDAWPDGIFEGPCRQESVSLLVPMAALGESDVCGRTDGHADWETWSHRLTWTCEGCLVPGPDTRGLSMDVVVGVAEGTIPRWDLFASLGS
jgi:hypothetical protein